MDLLHRPVDALPAPAAGALQADARWARCLALMLDEIDVGVLLLDAASQVRLLNRSARHELDDGHPLHLVSGHLHARGRQDTLALAGALGAAARHMQRELLWLGQGSSRVGVAVLPLGVDVFDGAPACMLLLGKRDLGHAVSVAAFARSHALTPAEIRVLQALCGGVPPAKIAEEQGVRISTVRTQIGNLRDKTGARSIRALVRMVAMLPPAAPLGLRPGSGDGRGALDMLLDGLRTR